MKTKLDFLLDILINKETVQKALILLEPSERENISDGDHSYKELYEHRIVLWQTILDMFYTFCPEEVTLIKAEKHEDGTFFEDYFLSLVVFKENYIDLFLFMILT